MKHILDVTVSYFDTVDTRIPRNGNLLKLLTAGWFKEDVERLRRELDPNRQSELKKGLPSFTVSGTFSAAGAEHLTKPSGLLCLDIDDAMNSDKENLHRMKEFAAQLPYVAYCGLSARGQGYFCIVPIAYPDKLKQHYRALADEFGLLFGIKTDPACTDVGRKRFVSFDDAPYVNPSAEVYCNFADIPIRTPEGGVLAQARYDSVCPSTDSEVRRYIAEIVKFKKDITTTYENWFRIACAFANAYGEEGREMFHQISQFYPKYSSSETDDLFDNVLNGRYAQINIGSFLYIARHAGLGGYADFMDTPPGESE
ncbi:BT4734/BF3469 family protein [Alistipes finegoldii]|uniref:BT4734/BF3469 family protein n=1 Tax=Alistipes finegoldii TaxID=214856 RepID=UPI0026771A83|nr:BT4734/BF3469 family protein [Alistipes finegoldii]